MDDKDRTLKALEDMKESMAYAVRRRATADVVTLEAQVLALAEQRDELAKLLTECLEMADNWPGVAYSYDLSTRCANALAALQVDGTARETSTVAQDK